MRLITISGLDGSGKSTQIELLKNYLGNQGKRVFYFHAGQFSISKTYNILRPHKVIQNKHRESIVSASWLQIQLRKIALFIDIWRFKMLLNKLLNKKYDYILSDRYFYDSVVNINYLSKAKLSDFLKLSFRIEKPDLAIYLQLDPEMIMSRERQPDQGLEYLQKKKELYDKYSVSWDMKIIDGNKSKEEIFENIKNLIS